MLKQFFCVCVRVFWNSITTENSCEIMLCHLQALIYIYMSSIQFGGRTYWKKEIEERNHLIIIWCINFGYFRIKKNGEMCPWYEIGYKIFIASHGNRTNFTLILTENKYILYGTGPRGIYFIQNDLAIILYTSHICVLHVRAWKTSLAQHIFICIEKS